MISEPPTGKREDVLAAARRLFATKNVAATRMPELAAEAGVGAGTVYRYFESKETLANAVYRSGKTRMLEILTEAASEPDSEAEFAAIWDGLSAFAAEDRDALLFVEAQQHAPYLDLESSELEEAVSALAIDAIERGQAAGILRPGNPARLAAVIFGAFVALVQVSGRTELSDADYGETKEMIWAALVRPGSAAGSGEGPR